MSRKHVTQGRAVDEDLLNYYSEKDTVDDVATTERSTHNTHTISSVHGDSQRAPSAVPYW